MVIVDGKVTISSNLDIDGVRAEFVIWIHAVNRAILNLRQHFLLTTIRHVKKQQY